MGGGGRSKAEGGGGLEEEASIGEEGQPVRNERMREQ